jgi:hypothetical protein
MITISEQRHQIIKRAILSSPAKLVDVSIPLWEKLHASLCTIIGEEGFNSLLTRSAYLNKSLFPWLVLDHDSVQSESPFAGIKSSLEKRALTHPDNACAGSISLLNAFVELLALLIGDHMTTTILRSAWGEEILIQAHSQSMQYLAEPAIKDKQP